MGETLFAALDAEWARVGTSPQACAALRRWAEADAVLAGFRSPSDLVKGCRSAEALPAAAVLGAVLRHALEPIAARTVLQAVLPALRGQAARRGGGSARRSSVEAWESGEDFDADVVAAAVGQIAALAGTSPPWPAQAICEAAWGCLRNGVRRSARRGAPPAALSDVALEAGSLQAAPSRSDAEDLALAVAGAVRSQWLDADDARIIYVTRVLGHTPAAVAAAVGRDVRALRAQRSRAERRLVRAGWAPTNRMVPCYSTSSGALTDVPPPAVVAGG
jgi:hypothetical protein